MAVICVLLLTSCNNASVSTASTASPITTPTTYASASAAGGPQPGALLTINGAPGQVRWTATQNVVGSGSAVLTMSGFPNIDESPYFSPSQLVGSPGEKITVQIVNQSLTEFTHNFSLNSQNIDQDIPWHQSVNETVVFPSSGALFFYCKYHNSIGQVGILRVSPAP